MKRFASVLLMAAAPLAAEKGFTDLFNGKDLTGWKVNEHMDTFSVKDGAIVAHGNRSHCFYVGNVMNHDFRNFELKVDVMTMPGSNGGIYIDTEYQPESWPGKGFEVQVNNTFAKDPRKTGSLYEVQDVDEATIHKLGIKDNEWFTEDIIAKGDTITVNLNGKQVVNWKQPADWNGTKDFAGRKIGSGTIALQGHDPGSTVYYKNIRIKALK
jgi:Domain of Unknown Function (DUF1080)